ncbi:hypothetical protein C8R44DRAFT_923381 [Mycena epipterygia]|nr:hypothetical protein C8R44DRAFT_923381 [Mycena epipterygia]
MAHSSPRAQDKSHRITDKNKARAPPEPTRKLAEDKRLIIVPPRRNYGSPAGMRRVSSIASGTIEEFACDRLRNRSGTVTLRTIADSDDIRAHLRESQGSSTRPSDNLVGEDLPGTLIGDSRRCGRPVVVWRPWYKYNSKAAAQRGHRIPRDIVEGPRRGPSVRMAQKAADSREPRDDDGCEHLHPYEYAQRDLKGDGHIDEGRRARKESRPMVGARSVKAKAANQAKTRTEAQPAVGMEARMA